MYPNSYEIFNEPYEDDSEDEFDIEDCGFDTDTNNCVLAGTAECDFFCPFTYLISNCPQTTKN